MSALSKAIEEEEAASQAYGLACEALSEARLEVARMLSEDVTVMLQELGMEGTSFGVDVR